MRSILDSISVLKFRWRTVLNMCNTVRPTNQSFFGCSFDLATNEWWSEAIAAVLFCHVFHRRSEVLNDAFLYVFVEKIVPLITIYWKHIDLSVSLFLFLSPYLCLPISLNKVFDLLLWWSSFFMGPSSEWNATSHKTDFYNLSWYL